MKSSLVLDAPMFFVRWIKALNARCQTAQGKASREFLAWRSRFLFHRVRLFAWIILAALLIAGSVTVFAIIPSLTADGKAVDVERVWIDARDVGIQIVAILIGLALCQRPLFRRHPERLFLLFSWLVLLPPHFHAIQRGEAQFDTGTWILVFAMQAILVPVHWRLHVISQTLIFGCAGLELFLGWRDPDLPLAAHYIAGGFLAGLICVVADIGVFLYEHSLRREFELRQQLQVFLHAVSHDLRNPVLGMVMMLKSFVNSTGESAQIPQAMLEQLIASGDRQVQLINSLLEAYATDVQGIPLQCQSMQLAPLVSEIITDFQPFLQQVKTSVENTISPDLPSITADPLQLRRVYENIISNALKYNPPGLRLVLEAEVLNSQWLRCIIRDNGVGMTQQQCDLVFDLYTRGRDQRRSLSLGLGLYMCRQIITAHGGEIGAISHPNQGATFWFTLPIQN